MKHFWKRRLRDAPEQVPSPRRNVPSHFWRANSPPISAFAVPGNAVPTHEAADALALPSDVLLLVFSHLDASSLCACARVCLEWKVLVDADEVWGALAGRVMSVQYPSTDAVLSSKRAYRRFTTCISNFFGDVKRVQEPFNFRPSGIRSGPNRPRIKFPRCSMAPSSLALIAHDCNLTLVDGSQSKVLRKIVCSYTEGFVQAVDVHSLEHPVAAAISDTSSNTSWVSLYRLGGSDRKVHTLPHTVEKRPCQAGHIQCVHAGDPGDYQVAWGCSGGELSLWDPEHGQLVWQVPQAHGKEGVLCLQRQGDCLFSGGRDRRVRMFDVRTGHCEASVITSSYQSVGSLSVAGDCLMTAPGFVMLWDLRCWKSFSRALQDSFISNVLLDDFRAIAVKPFEGLFIWPLNRLADSHSGDFDVSLGQKEKINCPHLNVTDVAVRLESLAWVSHSQVCFWEYS